MDTEKIRKMAKLEKYARDASEEMKPARYYRSDYIGKKLISTFFLVTIGYAVILGAYLGIHGEEILDQIYVTDINIRVFGWIALYVVVLILYLLLTYVLCTLRYAKAKKMEHYLDRQLQSMQKKEKNKAPSGAEKR